MLARDLIYDSRQLLLYSDMHVPEGKRDSFFPFIEKMTKGTSYDAIFDS